MGFYLLLAVFPDVLQGRTCSVFNDNLPSILCMPSLSSPDSRALDCALKVSALTALALACRVVPLFVPTLLNLSDPASRALLHAFFNGVASKGLSRPTFRTPPPSPAPPCWQALLLR